MIRSTGSLCVGLSLLVASPAGATENPEDFWGPSVIEAMINQSYAEGDFDRIEVFAQKLRESHQRFSDGKLFISLFYEQITPSVNWSFLPNRAPLAAWKSRYPNSPTPILVQAVGRAYVAYGDAYQAFLTGAVPDHNAIDQAELESVRKFLLAHGAVAKSDPYWFTLMATVSVALEREPEEILALVDEGLKAEPYNFSLVVAASARFIPERGGGATKLEAFAGTMLDKFKDIDGPGIYARIYWQALATHYKLTLFKTSSVDWAKLKPAIASLIARYPVGTHRNAGAVMACLAGDRAMTAELLWDDKFIPISNFWQDPDALGYCRNWAPRTQIGSAPDTVPLQRAAPLR